MTTTSQELREKSSKAKADARKLIETLDSVPESEREAVMQTARDKVKEAEGFDERATYLESMDRAEHEKRMDEERDAVRAQKEATPDAQRDRIENDDLVDRKWEEPSEAKREARQEVINRYQSGEKLNDAESHRMFEQFPEDRAFREFLQLGWSEMSDGARQAMRTMQSRASIEGQSDTAGKGAEVVPTLLMAQIAMAMDKEGPMLDATVTNRVNTATGADIDYPRSDDTSNEGSRVAALSNTALGNVGLGSFKSTVNTYSTAPIAVSLELVQDSVVNLENFVRGAMASRMGRIMNKEFTLGVQSVVTGVANMPVSGNDVNGQAVGTFIPSRTGATATATDVTLKEARGAMNLLKASVLRSPRCYWMMSNDVKNELASEEEKISGSATSGRPIWASPNLREGDPERLWGKRVVLNDFMDGSVAGKHSIVIGDFEQFLVRTAGPMQMQRLVERYAEYRAIAFNGWWRGGTVPLLPQAFAYVLQKS